MINNKLLKSAAGAGGLVPSENFNTVLYTGNQTARSITGLDFTPDLVWVKSRNEANLHVLTDSVRGTNKQLFSNQSDAESTSTNRLTGFDSNGFSIAAGNSLYRINKNNINYVAWSWKAGTTQTINAGVNSATRSSEVSANQAAGFSIVKLDKPNSNADTYNHGLSDVPEMIILKKLDTSDDWHCYHKDLGNSTRISLNNAAAKVTGTGVWNSTTPTTTLFSLQNQTGGDHIAYCFHSIAEYSKVGSFQGTGANQHIDCGFEPAWVMIKNTENTYRWYILDNKRNTTNPKNRRLFANDDAVEATNANILDFTTTGFQIITADAEVNQANKEMIFLAFAADPDTTTPTLAKSFNIDTYTGNGATQQIGSVNTLFTKFAIFNGTSSKITTAAISGLSTTSVSCWLKSSNSSSSERRGVIELNADTSSTGFAGTLSILYRYSDGSILVRSGNASSSETDILTHTDTSLRDGKWHNLILTRNESSGVSTLYIDGSQADQETVSSTSTVGGGTIIGDRFTGSSGNYNWDGQIDQLRIYNTVLNQAAVTQLYNETQASASTLNYPTGLGGLALYEFNDNAESTSSSTYNGVTSNITYDSFLFKPDLTIIKARNSDFNWSWTDTVRGVGNFLMSNFTDANIVNENSITAFNNAGFTLGTGVKSGTANSNGFNKVGDNYISYSLKFLDNNNNAVLENTVGTIKSLTSVNALAGMSIAKYTGNGTQNATIGTGLSSSPDMVIIKNLDQTDSWFVSHSGLSSNQFLELDNAAAATTNPDLNHERLSTTFKTTSASPHHMINASGENYIMYSFITTSTFSKFGSYEGGQSTGVDNQIDFGANMSGVDFVMIKNVDAANSQWMIFDTKRTNGMALYANQDSVEVSYIGDLTISSQGLRFGSNNINVNRSSETYIYWAMRIN